MTDQHRCERDGFPMLKIKGQWECVAEYIDRCIGQQPIVDVIQDGKTVYYVFENGHALPLLCSCCNGPLDVDVKADRRDQVGRRLESMAINYEVLDNGQEIEELMLIFSKKGMLAQPVGIPVSFNVAARMRHPADCPQRTRRQTPAKSTASSSKKKKRRYRNLRGRS